MKRGTQLQREFEMRVLGLARQYTPQQPGAHPLTQKVRSMVVCQGFEIPDVLHRRVNPSTCCTQSRGSRPPLLDGFPSRFPLLHSPEEDGGVAPNPWNTHPLGRTTCTFERRLSCTCVMGRRVSLDIVRPTISSAVTVMFYCKLFLTVQYQLFKIGGWNK